MTSKAEEIYDLIYEDIISGALAPGEKILIAAMAKKYDVGLSPVREALSQLTATDFVLAKSQCGFTIAPVSREDLSDIYTTRSYIEELALGLSIERGNENWEAEMLASFHKLFQFEKKHEINTIEHYRSWEERHRQFNLALISACGLQHLLKIQDKLYQQTERYRRIWLLSRLGQSNFLRNSGKQKKIMEAALEKDKIKAIELLHKYYEEAKILISEVF
jgi:GntR family transcriptional regulator, carbon starvation induced regulator